MTTGREKIGEGAIRKTGRQREIVTKLEPAEENTLKKRGTKKNDEGEEHKKRKYL